MQLGLRAAGGDTVTNGSVRPGFFTAWVLAICFHGVLPGATFPRAGSATSFASQDVLVGLQSQSWTSV